MLILIYLRSGGTGVQFLPRVGLLWVTPECQHYRLVGNSDVTTAHAQTLHLTLICISAHALCQPPFWSNAGGLLYTASPSFALFQFPGEGHHAEFRSSSPGRRCGLYFRGEVRLRTKHRFQLPFEQLGSNPQNVRWERIYPAAGILCGDREHPFSVRAGSAQDLLQTEPRNRFVDRPNLQTDR